MRSGGLRPLAVLGVLALAACTSGDAEGGVTAPPSPPATSETPTTEPTGEPTGTGEAVAPPEMPPEAREGTPEGAGAFARHWFQLVNFAYLTGDTEPVKDLSHPDCKSCVSIAEQVDDHVARGGTFAGGNIEITAASPTSLDERGVALVSLGYRQAPLVEMDRAGATTNSGASSSGSMAFYGAYDGARWVTFGIADE